MVIPADQADRSVVATSVHARETERWGRGAPVMIGRHPRYLDAQDRMQRFAASDMPVLVTGETGTGKELFARGVYLLSRREKRPFLTVNCAQYGDGHLIASELFGHRKGSFTGAAEDHAGVFEAADTGVLFLDEVTELSMPAQAMLLRVLSEGELVRVGDTRARRVDVRVVAATSSDLRALVQSGRFRADLYHRLRGLHIQVPPVRERGLDWELIREFYLGRMAETGARKRFSADAVDLLGRYAWPGNVRELKALVDCAYHLSDGDVIEPSHFAESLEEAARVEQLERLGGTVDAQAMADLAVKRLETLLAGEGDFWRLVHAPYLKRELSRAQVRSIVSRGLSAARGSYKKMLPLFGVPASDYLRFMDFLRHHDLKPRDDAPPSDPNPTA